MRILGLKTKYTIAAMSILTENWNTVKYLNGVHSIATKTIAVGNDGGAT